MKEAIIRILAIVLGLLAAMFSIAAYAAPAGIRILTDRSDFHLKSVTEQFTAETKIPVEVLYVDDGLLARVEARGEADIVISKNSSEVVQASLMGLLAPLPQAFRPQGLDPEFVDKGRKWFNMSYRLRSFLVAKGMNEYPKTYEDLANPAYKGTICMRSLSHAYSLELTAHMIAKHGEEGAAKWLSGVKANLARKPAGNDRDQAKAIANGECKIAVMNTYYMGLLLQDLEQRNWAQASNLVIPNQDDGGAFAMFSAVGVTKKGASHKEVAKLLSYLVNPMVQQYLGSINFEYPVVGVSGSEMVASFGKFQGLKPGDIKRSKISQETIAKNRAVALRLVNQL